MSCGGVFSPKRELGGYYQNKRQWTLEEQKYIFVYVKI